MNSQIKGLPQSIIQLEETIQNEETCLMQPERSTLIHLFQNHSISKISLRITFISFYEHQANERMEAYKKFIQTFSYNLPLYTQIDTISSLRMKILSQLVELSKKQKNRTKKFMNDAYDKLEQYRLKNLQYFESLTDLCQLLSQQKNKLYENIMKKCSRIFIKLHETNINSNILPNLFEFSLNFDPLLINLKAKNEYINFKLQRKLSQDNLLQKRLAFAQQQIMKSINQESLQMTSGNQKQQLKINTAPFLKYNNDPTKVHSRIFNNQNNFMELKSSIKFKVRQNRTFAKSHDKQKKQTTPQKIVQNFRKKSLQHRLTTSVDQTNQDPGRLQRATISTENYSQMHKKVIRSNQRYINLPKRLNFRTINLQPLENHNLQTSISIGNIYPVEAPEKQKEPMENVSIFNLKRKPKKEKKQMSQSDKSVIEDFSDFDSPERVQKYSKKQSPSSNKLAYILSKRKYRKFESDEDATSGLQDDSSVKHSGASQSNGIKKRTNSKDKSEPLIDESMILQYRKRRISEVDEDSGNSLICNNVNEVRQMDRQMSKTKLIDTKRQDDDMLGSTTNIQSKGSEIDGHSCTQQANKIKQKQKQLTQKQTIQLPLMGPFDTQSLAEVTEKESSSSHDVSFQKIEQHKPQQNKIKRKIILKAAKVNHQDMKKYFETFGFHNYDSLLKQISTHQHYICEFYLNQAIFNIVVFCPSIDFRSIEVKLIYEVENPEINLFESLIVKQKFRKVVLKNFVQIIEKSASLIFSSILIKKPLNEQMWIKDCEFVPCQEDFIYYLKSSPKQQKTNQFVSISGSVFSIRQHVNQTFLYSDQISPFKGGKYDINEKIFTDDEFSLLPSFTCKGLTTMKEINEILELKDIDTFQVSSAVEALIFRPQQNVQNQADLRTFTLEQILNRNFVIANGWIKTTSQLIFNDKNQKIASIALPGKYEILFGRGFEHIVTMKNKITHHKTRMNSKKNSQFTSKIYNTEIRMFSKQLYGLIKHQNGVAHYGNWQMNFHFKHEFLGRVIYSFDLQANQNRLIFGNSTFFVTIYQGDQFIIGWQVEENDCLY